MVSKDPSVAGAWLQNLEEIADRNLPFPESGAVDSRSEADFSHLLISWSRAVCGDGMTEERQCFDPEVAFGHPDYKSVVRKTFDNNFQVLLMLFASLASH